MTRPNPAQAPKGLLNQKKTELKKILNLKQKEMFREWLITAKDENSFSATVEIVGKEWHVFRNVKSGDFPKFANNLWEHIKDIQNATYLWHKSQYQAYSYESKICFLINPSKYRLIYDDNIKATLKSENKLKKFTNLSIKKENWMEVVNDYYEKCVESNPSKPEDFFQIDCDLWADGA